MNTNYWVKKEAYKEVLTKTLIPNKGNFSLMAYHFNAMDKKGIGFYFDKNIEFKNDKMYIKNGYKYLVIERDDFKEFLILPNDNTPELAERVVSKIDKCKTEKEVLDLIIAVCKYNPMQNTNSQFILFKTEDVKNLGGCAF